MSAQPESKLSRAIMAALRNRGIYCFKVHGGPMTQAGTPDIVACVPIDSNDYTGTSPPYHGVFVGFETKMPDGKDPTPVQRLRHNQIRAACGHVCVPRSVDDAVAFIEALGYMDPRPNPVRPAPGN